MRRSVSFLWLKVALLALALVALALSVASPSWFAGAGSAESAEPWTPPEWVLPDAFVPPQEHAPEGLPGAPPSVDQTSEFMAGSAVASVIFVESSGGSGNCSPADTQSETWSGARQAEVIAEISAGLSFWTSRTGRPDLSFTVDNLGSRATSCEPISRPNTDQALWMADALTAAGYPATTANYITVSRTAAAARRAAYGSDWAYLIFVVDSLNDADGSFSNGYFAYAALNGPFMVMTYDNDGWGIGNMNLVAAHETGHIFGALDEYPSSGCSVTDSWGYLNAANTSCNNGGITTDISIMGPGGEMADPAVDVSTSARDALGWRNPAVEGSQTVVDVVRTSTVSLTPYTPDPTGDDTPAYSATAGNEPFPPEGPRIYFGFDLGTALPVSISSVADAEWNVDAGGYSSSGVVADDGTFDEETEGFTFTVTPALPNGAHTIGARAVNDFGHRSTAATDGLTVTEPIVVSTTGDELNTDGDCSLREAIEAANTDSAVDACVAGSGFDIIDVPAGTYTLGIAGAGEDANATGDLDVLDDLVIDGAGATATIVDGDELDRVVDVAAGVTAELIEATVQNGRLTGRGGGIRNSGSLNISNASIENNSADGVNHGGGIDSAGTLTVRNSTISGNAAGYNGGGIMESGMLVVENTTISGNTAQGLGGGGVGGGGMYAHDGATLTITNSTITDNEGVGGRGIQAEALAAVSVKNTIVANNVGTDCGGPITSLGNNLSSDATCGFTAAGDLENTDPLLGPLASNGGSTQTHALLAGSPAIDAGSGDCPPPPTDQRGTARPFDGDGSTTAECDIGAYEKTSVEEPTPDGDGDGCSNLRELGPDPALGGLRDPLNAYDFFDPAGPSSGPPDQYIDLVNDILGVISRYSANPVLPYNAAFDRGPVVGIPPWTNAWNRTAPDGTIDLVNDILSVILQYHHDCR